MESNRIHNVGDDEELQFEFSREYAALTWKILHDKFNHIEFPLLEIPSMASNVYTSLNDLQKKHMIDVSIPKKKFEEVLEMIERVKKSESAQRNNVDELKSRLESCLKEERKKDRFYATLRSELMDVDDQLRVLLSKKQKIESFLAKLEKDRKENSDEISVIQRDISNITLNSSVRKQLHHKIEDLKTFTWDPSYSFLSL